MATDVVMPQMGESIAEGTVIRWMKKAGEKVERDEPLFEISTDKVDAEIPSPAAGTLTEILAQEGQTVAVNSVVARIATDGESAAPAPPAQAKAAPAPASAAPPPAAPAAPKPASAPSPAPPPPAPAATVPDEEAEQPVASLDERRRTKSSPLVRKIAKENDVDVSQLKGTGVSGRVTKNDILEFLQQPRTAEPAAPAAAVSARPIAQHMILSKQTSAHVTTVFEVDFTAIEKLRRQQKDAFAERGVKLTYLPFIVQAVLAALREFPILNASMDESSITYHRDLNIGIAVALEWGLIVPVVKNADEKNILGLARTINDLGERARTKKLSPDEVQGGTFTITNPGIYGGLFGTPIINQPQVAILGVGGVKKRPVVVETKDGDFIAIRSMCYLALTFDHRLVDGATADQFMARIRQIIEAGQFTM